jgi:uncharacterized membrane protein YgdD (TMEM256/DUF423 family)
MQFLSSLTWNAQTLGALSAASSVLLGAFGSHGLKNNLSDLPKDDQSYYLDIWKTAAQYQMYHSIGMIIAPMICKHVGMPNMNAWPHSAKLFASGIAFFSGSLYTLVLTRTKFLGAITPIGGVLFAAGWVAMACRE